MTILEGDGPAEKELSYSGRGGIQLTNQQQLLLREVNRIDPVLGDMYMGSIAVLQDLSNPDRYSQAANSLRELMYNIVKLRGGSTVAHDSKIGNEVHLLQKCYEKNRDKTGCYSEGEWKGAVDDDLAAILKSLQGFIESVKKKMPGMESEIRKTLNGMDHSGHSLPENLIKELIEKWIRIYRYFESIKHHGDKVEPESIIEYRSELERLVLQRVAPQTYEDHRAINELIKEGEGDDN